MASSFLERNGDECSGREMLQVIQVRNANIKATLKVSLGILSCHVIVSFNFYTYLGGKVSWQTWASVKKDARQRRKRRSAGPSDQSLIH